MGRSIARAGDRPKRRDGEDALGLDVKHNLLFSVEMLVLAYFVVHETLQILLVATGGAATWREALRGRYKTYPEELIDDWLGITVVIPPYNEGATLVATVTSALSVRYPGELDVVVVDDSASRYGGKNSFFEC